MSGVYPHIEVLDGILYIIKYFVRVLIEAHNLLNRLIAIQHWDKSNGKQLVSRPISDNFLVIYISQPE